ncbi:hypothetical protein C5469_00845 [Photorhabdus cinerea]|uniref:Phage tail collar domain-containing protein n=2 Tax=Photorhabdus cinerea TaxID=471575 RepID=A0A7X5QAG0_9GAMM|nr:hypothetical protein [Photorhabdus cinerea]
MPPVSTPDNVFHDGDPTTGAFGTIVPALWLNNIQFAVRDLQQECKNILTSAGFAPDPRKQNQLADAISQLIKISVPAATVGRSGIVSLSNATNSNSETDAATSRAVKAAYDNANTRLEKSKNGADIPNKNEFVKNLGLAAGSALPVGVPIPWPLATPPAGWMKCNGATFTAAQYPELARVYPALRLPDLRGEFIRGWDDGRGVDAGRALLSLQRDLFKSHNHYILKSWASDRVDPSGGGYAVGADAGGYLTDIPISNEYTGGNETRPRNIAFNYIVRAV